MSANVDVKVVKNGPTPTSCGECQRRKQRCSREWPCNHCQARKVPHLCQFPSRESPLSTKIDGPPAANRQQKREGDSSVEEPAQDPDLELAKGLSKLGYAPDSGVLTFARQALALTTTTTTTHADAGHDEGNNAQTEDIKTALRSVLPKLYSGRSIEPRPRHKAC